MIAPLARVLAVLLATCGSTAAQTEITIQSFNIYNGGESLEKTAEAIRATGADVVGLQEVRAESDPCTADACPAAPGPGVTAALAELLGFHFHEQRAENEALWANGILSRWPITSATKNDLGVRIEVPGRNVWVFNVHLDDSPYQPYQALKIEYGAFPFTDDPNELADWAAKTRGAALKLLSEDLQAAAGADAMLLFGDFNEPSHLDWTAEAVAAGLQPLVVPYPTSKSIAELGFVDTFRAAHPDVVAKPGFTWTPTTDPTDPEDHHDRIDFVYARAAGLAVLAAGVVGEKAPEADVVVTPWQSDHRSVFARIAF